MLRLVRTRTTAGRRRSEVRAHGLAAVRVRPRAPTAAVAPCVSARSATAQARLRSDRCLFVGTGLACRGCGGLMVGAYTEAGLVEGPSLELLKQLGWTHINAFDETFGATGTLGRDT